MTKNKKTCVICEREISPANYYQTKSIELFPDGRIPQCKDCCKKIVDEGGFEAVKSLMRMLNKPLLSKLYKGDYKDYIRMMNSMPQYSDSGFDESDFFADNAKEDESRYDNLTILTKEEFIALEIMFGEGYTEKEYVYIQEEYQDYLNRVEVDTKQMENIIKEICVMQLTIRKKRAANEDVDKQIKTLQDLLGTANLKPVQETGADSIKQESFGTLIKHFEQNEPIPEPSEKWKDVDNIAEYYRTYFLGHLIKVFGKENPYQEEYDRVIAADTVTPPSYEQLEGDE